MTQRTSKAWFMGLAAALALTFGSTAALADKDHDKHHKHKHKYDDDHGGKHAHKHKKERREARVGRYFDDDDRRTVRVYYVEHYGGSKGCPPGLAKKNNGCMPPGHARRYNVGQPLPTTVVYYPVPQPVLVQLPPPPVGHKYVRVAADILLIAVGTSMVVDAVTDLSRL